MNNKFTIFDSEFIENINNAMVMIFETQFDLYGKALVIEDGRITQVEQGDRIVREMPEVGDSVYIDYEFIGCLHNSPEGAPVPVIYIGDNLFSAPALQMEYPGKTIMFEKARY